MTRFYLSLGAEDALNELTSVLEKLKLEWTVTSEKVVIFIYYALWLFFFRINSKFNTFSFRLLCALLIEGKVHWYSKQLFLWLSPVPLSLTSDFRREMVLNLKDISCLLGLQLSRSLLDPQVFQRYLIFDLYLCYFDICVNFDNSYFIYFFMQLRTNRSIFM